MKTPSADLFELIHSLGKGEKRYLRLQVGDPAPAYWDLFEAILAQSVPDEGKLIQKHAGADYLKNLAVSKRYLEHWILDHLDRYRKKQIEELCWDELDRIRTWIDRRFWKKAEKEIQKLEKRAKEYELFDVLIQTFKLRKQILGNASGKPPDSSVIEALFHGEQKALHQLVNQNQFWLVLNRLYEIQRRQDRSGKDLERWGNHPFLRSIDAATNLQSKLSFYQAKAIFAFTNSKVKEALSYNQSILQLMDENPKLLRLYPERYLSTLNNFLVDCIETGSMTMLENGLAQLKELPARNEFKRVKDLDVRVFRQSNLLEINRVLREKSYHDGANLLSELEAGLTKFGDRIARHHRLSLTYLCGYLHFLNQNWEAALRLLQPLARQEREDVVLEIFYFSRILFLLTHFELENYDLVESLLSSFRRTDRKNKENVLVEKSLFRFIRKYIQQGDKNLKKEYLTEIQDLKGNRFFDYVDLEWWLRI